MRPGLISVSPLLFMMLLSFLLGACGGDAPNATPTQSGNVASTVRGVSDTEILIGSHTDLSGPTALIGVAVTNGARMRIEEANKAGGIHGRQIRFIVEDQQYQVPRSIQAVNKLVNRDQVFAMLLGLGTPMNNAIMPTLIENNVPNLFPISGARSMVDPYHPLQFVARGIYYDEIRAAAKYFIERGAARPCVIYQDTDYGQEILDGARDQVAEMGMELAAVSAHKPTDSEFTSAILRLRGAGCDLVLMGTVHRDTILIFEAARKMGWTGVQWAGNNASYSQAVADLESGASEGFSTFVHIAQIYGDDPNLSPEVAAWWDAFVERFGVNPEFAAMEGYRNADLLVRALENAGRDLTPEGLVAGMEALGEVTDPFGYALSFGPGDHEGVKQSVLSTVVGGRWVTQEESISY